jgi:hypothetical protein
MADKFKATQVKLGGTKGKPVRFSHLHVHKPHLNTQNKKLEYSVQIWVPKENVEDKELLDAAVAEQLANYKKIDGDTGPDFHYPVRDGDTLKDKKGKAKPVPGCWVISAKTAAVNEDGTENEPPGVVGTERDLNGKLKPLSSAQIKSGDWGRVSINFKFFTKGDGGIGVYLNNIQKVKDGEALGGRRAAADEFDDYVDDEEEDILG